MSIIVFYLNPNLEPKFAAQYESLEHGELSESLKRAEHLRKLGMRHVSISVENPDSVGKPGVSSVEDGKTPDGHAYEWSKQHRAGKTRR